MTYIKEAFKRGLIGILCGTFLSNTILMMVSLGKTNITLDASIFVQQYFIYAISGFYFSAISVIFNIEEWSVLKQVVSHVCLTIPFLPLAYYIKLMPNNTLGIVVFVSIYLSCYALSFVIYKAHLIKEAKLINEAL